MIHQIITEDFNLNTEKRQKIRKIITKNNFKDKKFQIKNIIQLKKKDKLLDKLISIEIQLDISKIIK